MCLHAFHRFPSQVEYAPLALPAIDMWSNGVFLAEMLLGSVQHAHVLQYALFARFEMPHLTHALTLQVFKVNYGTGSSSGESGYESEAEITAVLRRLPLTADKKLFLASKVLLIS
jgi:hypothetical protein